MKSAKRKYKNTEDILLRALLSINKAGTRRTKLHDSSVERLEFSTQVLFILDNELNRGFKDLDFTLLVFF